MKSNLFGTNKKKAKVIRITSEELIVAINAILSKKGMSYAKIKAKPYKNRVEFINHLASELWMLIEEKETEMP